MAYISTIKLLTRNLPDEVGGVSSFQSLRKVFESEGAKIWCVRGGGCLMGDVLPSEVGNLWVFSEGLHAISYTLLLNLGIHVA